MSDTCTMLVAARDVREAAADVQQRARFLATADPFDTEAGAARPRAEIVSVRAALDALDEARRAVWVERMSARVAQPAAS